MKGIGIVALFLALTSCSYSERSKIEFPNDKNENEYADSTYFSYTSICNINIQFHPNNILDVTFNEKKTKGTIQISQNDSGFYTFIDSGKPVFVFFFENYKLLIVNENYQFSCEDSKIITLNKLHDSAAFEEFKQYLNEHEYVLDNDENLNNKACFLESKSEHEIAIFLLDKVIEKHSDREAAYINLGDIYWKINNREKAKNNYTLYNNLMKNRKNENKIPERVYQRLK